MDHSDARTIIVNLKIQNFKLEHLALRIVRERHRAFFGRVKDFALSLDSGEASPFMRFQNGDTKAHQALGEDFVSREWETIWGSRDWTESSPMRWENKILKEATATLLTEAMAQLFTNMHKRVWPDHTPVQTRAQLRSAANSRKTFESHGDSENALKKVISMIRENEKRQLPVATRESGTTRKSSLNHGDVSSRSQNSKGRARGTKHGDNEPEDAEDGEEDESSDPAVGTGSPLSGAIVHEDEDVEALSLSDDTETSVGSVGDEDFRLNEDASTSGSEFTDGSTVASTRKRSATVTPPAPPQPSKQCRSLQRARRAPVQARRGTRRLVRNEELRSNGGSEATEAAGESSPRTSTRQPNSDSDGTSNSMTGDSMESSHPDASEAAPGTSTVEAAGPAYWNAISHATTRTELDALMTDDQFEQILRARLRTSQSAFSERESFRDARNSNP